MLKETTTAITQIFRIEIWKRENPLWRAGNHISGEVRARQLFFVQGDLTEGDVERLCAALLVDPVTESFVVSLPEAAQGESWFDHTVDVTLLPGVTDPAAENLVRAAALTGITGLARAATGQRYLITGNLSREQLEKLASGVFSNTVIQRYSIDEPITPPFVPVQEVNDRVEVIDLKDADDALLLQISQERRLSLDLNEMRAIRDYFAREQRNPTDAELEMLAQTWSEHCVHKTFKARIDYTGPEGQQMIDGLLKTYIRAATERINKAWVRSAFVDNAGIVAFDDRYDLAFKVETHNRPSAIEPFGGANTGSGGVIRDVLGVSARPIANTDILCFGPPDIAETTLPAGVLHPRRIAEGVVSGIEDYGNKMGIPTVNGAIVYHPGYTSNPLVFCGCLGILPHGSHRSKAQPDDLIVVIGGRTGRDGLRGATFSSMEMDTTTSVVSGGAVQIGHPIHEKQVQEVVLRARDEGLYTAITDCGAGGLSSAVGEMGQDIGADVQLDFVPLKYPGLQPWEIWLSEAQERMVLAVPQENWARLKRICDGQDVEAVAIGTFASTGRLTLRYGDTFVGDISMHFLHDGIPQRHLTAIWQPPVFPDATPPIPDAGQALLGLLALPAIRSKEDVIRRYDHEVQGGTAVKPLVGDKASGPGDAAVLVPGDVQSSSGAPQAVALSNGLCPAYGEIDPYAMAWAAVDEALRNLVAVGADPDRVSILDNFSWGNAALPDRLGALVRCAQGCYDAAVAYGTPFISGKDSLNNEYLGDDGQRHAIPGTLVISGLGIVPDVTRTVTMDLKGPGNVLYVVGRTRDELGGSHYHLLTGAVGGTVPQPVPDSLDTLRRLHRAIQTGVVRACHDVSDGGLAVALSEMCIAGGLGAALAADSVAPDLDPDSQLASVLFAESSGRFIVEVRPADAAVFEDLLSGSFISRIGIVGDSAGPFICRVSAEPSAPEIFRIPLADLEKSWRGELESPQSQAINFPAASVPVTETRRTSMARVGRPKVLILHANGTNRDRDAALACELAGGQPEIVHVNQIFSGERDLLDYHMVIVPGGFSYGDDLGAGVLWALDLRERLGVSLDKFIADGRPVLGICNGFQALVKAGFLPGADWSSERRVTLTRNASARFECRWVYLQPNPFSPCLFTEGLSELIHCPVAHGEGRVAVSDAETAQQLWADGLPALMYVDEHGQTAGYPVNPNGSVDNIAGFCNRAGNVFGLMPHPENHIFPWQNPRVHRGASAMLGLSLFKNGIKYS